MRRNLFGRPSELPTTTSTSAQEALLFDVRDQTESADLTLAERRLGNWEFAPWLVFAGHLVIAASLLLQNPAHVASIPPAGVAIPLILSLLLDAASGVLMLSWRKLQMAPHSVMRIMCGYLAASGGFWTAASIATGSLQLADPTFVTLAMSAGFFVRSLVAVPSPPLALVNAIVALVTTVLFSRNVQVSFAIDVSIFLVINIHFSESWSESRQIA